MAGPTASTRPIAVLFIVDTSEATAERWEALLRVCQQLWRAARPAECGVLLVRSRYAAIEGEAPVCTPSGFTTDASRLWRWLSGVQFDGGVGRAEHVEALVTAARDVAWPPDAVRHCLLLTDGEPRPLTAPAALALRSRAGEPRSRSAGAPSPWSPAPEALAAAAVSLSVASPRRIEALCDLHARCLAAAGMPQPLAPARGLPDGITVISPYFPAASSSHAPSWSPPQAQELLALPSIGAFGSVGGRSPLLPSPTPRDGATSPLLSLHPARFTASAPASAAAAGFDGGAPVWQGGLQVVLKSTMPSSHQQLGPSALSFDKALPTQVRAAFSPLWERGVTIIEFVKPQQREALLRGAEPRPAAYTFSLTVSGSPHRGAELFAVIAKQDLWAELHMGVAGYRAIVDSNASAANVMRGYILPAATGLAPPPPQQPSAPQQPRPDAAAPAASPAPRSTPTAASSANPRLSGAASGANGKAAAQSVGGDGGSESGGGSSGGGGSRGGGPTQRRRPRSTSPRLQSPQGQGAAGGANANDNIAKRVSGGIAAMSSEQYEKWVANLGEEARSLFDGLRRKVQKPS